MHRYRGTETYTQTVIHNVQICSEIFLESLLQQVFSRVLFPIFGPAVQHTASCRSCPIGEAHGLVPYLVPCVLGAMIPNLRWASWWPQTVDCTGISVESVVEDHGVDKEPMTPGRQSDSDEEPVWCAPLESDSDAGPVPCVAHEEGGSQILELTRLHAEQEVMVTTAEELTRLRAEQDEVGEVGEEGADDHGDDNSGVVCSDDDITEEIVSSRTWRPGWTAGQWIGGKIRILSESSQVLIVNVFLVLQRIPDGLRSQLGSYFRTHEESGSSHKTYALRAAEGLLRLSASRVWRVVTKVKANSWKPLPTDGFVPPAVPNTARQEEGRNRPVLRGCF